MNMVGRNLVYSSWGKSEMGFIKSFKSVSGSSDWCLGMLKIRMSCLFLVCLSRTLYYLLIAQKRCKFVSHKTHISQAIESDLHRLSW